MEQRLRSEEKMKRWMALFLCVLMLASCTPKAETPTGEQSTAGETAQKQNRKDTKIHRTQEEKDKGWKIFPDMGVKYLMNSDIWKANGAYLYADLAGNTSDEKSKVYSGIYYNLFTPKINEALNALYTDKSFSEEELVAKEVEILKEMKPLFGVYTLRKTLVEGKDYGEITHFPENEILFEDEEYITLMATAPYDEKGLEGEEKIAYKALWEDVKKVRESMVVERPLTLAQTLGSLNINEFRSLDLEGKEVKLGDIFKENKVTMVNVWATFCPPCREELPDIAKLGKEMKEKGVAVLGIVGDTEEGTDENLEEAKKLLRAAEAEYVNLVGSEDMNTIIEYIAGYPTTFFVNSEGKIIGAAFVGGQSEETFKKAIEALLK